MKGIVQCGVEVVWCKVVWRVVWCGVWCGVACGVVWCSGVEVIRCNVVQCNVVW